MSPYKVAPRRAMITRGRSLPRPSFSSYGTHDQTTSPGSAVPSRSGAYEVWISAIFAVEEDTCLAGAASVTPAE